MIDISNTTKQKIPRHAYEKITYAVHGKDYELSVVFCGKHLMQRMNRETRGKDYATDVLSFPLSNSIGEMFICLEVCDRKRIEHERTLHSYVGMLFVHGLVHLKGHDHGATMDRLEASYRKQFGL